MFRKVTIVLLTFLVSLFFLIPAYAQTTAFVTDEAGLLRSEEIDTLEKTAAELKKRVDEYFASVEGAGDFPDYAGMKLFIGIKSDATINKYCEDAAFKDIFDEAELRRESFRVRTMARDNKRAQGCLNALKQPKNGGYTDRPVDNQERKLIIKMDGVGLEAFK